MAYRDNIFDNLKGILIFLVVFGHVSTNLYTNQNIISRQMVNIIYSFHMPAFIFISGFFSKSNRDDNSISKDIKNILLPFLFFNLLMWLLLSCDPKTLFTPQRMMWYLLSLFLWKNIIPILSKFKYALLFSILLSLLIGLRKTDGFMAISRTVGFFPYFLIGYLTSNDIIYKIREKTPKIIAIVLILLVFTSVIVMNVYFHLPIKAMCEMYKSYADQKLEGLLGPTFRLLCFCLGIIVIFCLLVLISNKHCFLTTLGQNSITVYLLHTFTVIFIVQLFDKILFVPAKNDILLFAISFGIAITICFAFGNSSIKKCYKCLFDIIGKSLLH